MFRLQPELGRAPGIDVLAIYRENFQDKQSSFLKSEPMKVNLYLQR